MSAQHTKGPWEMSARGDYGDYDGNCRVIIGDDTRVAVVQDHGPQFPWAEANARLIAAAPDLLAFAKLVARHFEHTRLPLGIAARAVIAKASVGSTERNALRGPAQSGSGQRCDSRPSKAEAAQPLSGAQAIQGEAQS
jgi:hypothetical protein